VPPPGRQAVETRLSGKSKTRAHAGNADIFWVPHFDGVPRWDAAARCVRRAIRRQAAATVCRGFGGHAPMRSWPELLESERNMKARGVYRNDQQRRANEWSDRYRADFREQALRSGIGGSMRCFYTHSHADQFWDGRSASAELCHVQKIGPTRHGTAETRGTMERSFPTRCG